MLFKWLCTYFQKINNERKREQASISHSPINYKLDNARHNE